jgi:hypothetical protein
MKKLTTVLLGLIMSVTAFADINVVTVDSIQKAELARTISTLSLIDWKVGDSTNYKVSISGFGMEGTMTKEAFAEEGNAIWVRQELKLPIMNDKSEMLFDRDSAQVIKYIHNGKEETPPESKVEVISTKQETIEVPAGKFKVLHVMAKSKDVKDIQIWMNPREIPLDGGAKVYMDQGSAKITLTLLKFVKQN